jgi:hypothetical protein
METGPPPLEGLGAGCRCFYIGGGTLPDLRHHLPGGLSSTFLAFMVGAPRYLVSPPRVPPSTFLALMVDAPVSPSPPSKGPAIDILSIDGGCSQTSGIAS